MLNMLFGVLVGIVIGWNLPQPAWAKQMQERVVKTFNDLTGKKG